MENRSIDVMQIIVRSPVALFAILILLGLSVTNSFAQTPFYLTFERSFSPLEETQLRIDYLNTEQPIHVRVLRPKSVEVFLDGQIQISRSYEEPRAALNPGYYLGEGVNEVKSPLEGFRRLLSVEFREQWNGLLSPPLRSPSATPAITTPKKVVHEAPAGFEVVSDLHLDLQKGGERPEDQWWWFFNQAPTGSAYTVKTVSLGKLPIGLFLVQAIQGDSEAQAILQVSDAAVQVKQSSRDLAVRVIDRKGGVIPGVTISVREENGKWSPTLGTTNEHGECLIKDYASEFSSKLVVRAQQKDGTAAFSDTDFVPISPSSQSMFLSTDRPIFRPGEEVQFKGVVRDLVEGKHVIPDATQGSNVKVTLQRQDGTAAGQLSEVSISQFGSVSGKISLAEVDPPGLYRLVAEVSGRPYSGELRVRDYVKPTFYLELAESSGLLRSGSKFDYTIKAKRFAGGAPTGAKYEVYVYRKKFETPQFVEESGGGLSTSSDYFGGAQSASSLSQPHRIYTSIEQRTPESERAMMGEAWNTAPQFDADGYARGSIELPPLPQEAGGRNEWTYSLMFRAMDAAGTMAVLSKDFYQTLSPGVVTVKFSKSAAQVGEGGIRCNLRVTTPEGEALGGVSGELELTLTTPTSDEKIHSMKFTTNSDGYASILLPEIQKAGVLVAKAVARSIAGTVWEVPAASENAELLLMGSDGDPIRKSTDVALFTDSTIVSPGEKPKVFAILPDVWGVGNAGVIWRTIAGTKVHSTSASTIAGRSYTYVSEAKEEYGTGYFETLTVPLPNGKFRESTLGFRIIPWNKRLKVIVSPHSEIGEPMKPFVVKARVTYGDGSPAAGSEVSLGIVDKAVYSVQPDFRPSIFDFFFPMPRLNLMTFYSDELQGYGYADMIRKPNFSLSALKSQAKLSKRTARDTAGWYPHLVADAQGEVVVTVPMPSNLTEWIVTATAVDKGGKVGEGSGMFRTAVDIEVEPRVPQFVRAGDTLKLPMTILNHATEVLKVSAAFSATQGGKGIGEVSADEVNLQASGRESIDLPLEGIEGDATVYLSAALSLPEKSEKRAGGAREFEVASLPTAQRVSVAAFEQSKSEGRAKLDVVVPEGSTVRSLNVQVATGLLGLLLSNAKHLVTYPYGCAEQLAHSTFPNIALLKISEGIPDLQGTFKEFGPLVAKAKANTIVGIKRLVSNQKPSGGFSLWPSDPVESPLITAMVIQVLQAASEVGVAEADNPLWKASSWLESVSKSHPWTPYELLILPRNSGSSEVVGRGVEFVSRTMKNLSAPFEDVVISAALVGRYEDISWHTFNTQLTAAFPGIDVLGKLRARQSDMLENGVLTGAVSPSVFSNEPLGFSASELYLLSIALQNLPSEESKFAGVRQTLRSRIFEKVRNGFADSPFDRGRLVEAIAPAVATEIKLKSEGLKNVSVALEESKKTLALAAIPGGASGTFTFDGREQVKSLSVIFSGIPADSVVGAIAEADVTFSALTSVNYGVEVSRTLSRVTPTGRVPLKPGELINIGDTVISEISVHRAGGLGQEHLPKGRSTEQPSDWVVIRDGIPSIAEAIDNDRTLLADAKVTSKPSGAQAAPDKEGYEFWGQVKETLRYPDRTERVVKLRPGEKCTSYSVWRAAFRGTAMVPPAEVVDMYAPTYRAASGVWDIVVR